MIDLHNHIVYEIDDGSKNIEMSENMAKIAVNEGINTIVATPHYIYGANIYTKEFLLERISQLNEMFKQKGIDLTVLPGNELMIDQHIVKDIVAGKCLTLNNSKYILVEFPQIGIPKESESILYSIITKGYIPIIAHPERYSEIQKNPKFIVDYLQMGCITQLNSTSIIGLSGELAKKTAQILLENNAAHLVSTDSHSDRKRSPKILECKAVLENWVGKVETRILMEINPEKVIKSEDIEKKSFGKFERKSIFTQCRDSLKRFF